MTPGVTATAISAEVSNNLAIGSDDNLYAWGDNFNGQLGDGTNIQKDSPELITLAPGVKPAAVAAGLFDSLAIGSDGNLYAWGANYVGQLGDGTTTNEYSPELITLAPASSPPPSLPGELTPSPSAPTAISTPGATTAVARSATAP